LSFTNYNKVITHLPYHLSLTSSPIWGWCQWKEGGYKERVWEGEYDRNITHSYMKIEKCKLVKLFQEPGKRIKENDRRGEFNYDIL
jgi:hypothetical protein